MTVIFPKEPFKSLNELVRTFGGVDLEHGSLSQMSVTGGDGRGEPGGGNIKAASAGNKESLVWHVSNIAARFGSLVEVRMLCFPSIAGRVMLNTTVHAKPPPVIQFHALKTTPLVALFAYVPSKKTAGSILKILIPTQYRPSVVAKKGTRFWHVSLRPPHNDDAY